jgi:hypothetical protein
MSSDIIQNLVSRFADHLQEYKSPSYNEAQVRHDFIDSFFEALGWDVFNKQGFSQTFRQVIDGNGGQGLGAWDWGGKDGDLGLGTRNQFSECHSPIPDPKPLIPVSNPPTPVFKAVYDCRIGKKWGRIWTMDIRKAEG